MIISSFDWMTGIHNLVVTVKYNGNSFYRSSEIELTILDSNSNYGLIEHGNEVFPFFLYKTQLNMFNVT